APTCYCPPVYSTGSLIPCFPLLTSDYPQGEVLYPDSPVRVPAPIDYLDCPSPVASARSCKPSNFFTRSASCWLARVSHVLRSYKSSPSCLTSPIGVS